MEIRKWRVRRTDQIFRTVVSRDKKNRFREFIVPMPCQRCVMDALTHTFLDRD